MVYIVHTGGAHTLIPGEVYSKQESVVCAPAAAVFGCWFVAFGSRFSVRWVPVPPSSETQWNPIKMALING